MTARLALILGFVFIDMLGFSLILPLLPFYGESFGATPAVVGLLLGANAVPQLIGAPMIGRLSDRYGRRPMLLVSIAGTLVGFVMLGLAGSLFMLFASRVLDGLLGGDISLAQAYISDVTSDQDRAKGLGLIGAAFGISLSLVRPSAARSVRAGTMRCPPGSQPAYLPSTCWGCCSCCPSHSRQRSGAHASTAQQPASVPVPCCTRCSGRAWDRC